MARPVTVTAFGNAQVDTAQSKFGGASLLLDGSGDQLRTSNKVVPLTSDFTIEGWVYPASTGTMYDLFTQFNPNSAEGRTFCNTITSNQFQAFIGNSSGSMIITSTATHSADRFYHYAFVRQGNVFRLFIDGNLEGTNTVANIAVVDTPLNIGLREGFPTDTAGNIDEVRISNTARYTVNFTPQTSPHVNDANTLLLLHMDGTDGSTDFIDDTRTATEVPRNNNAILVRSPVISTTDKKVGTSSLYLDGSSAVAFRQNRINIRGDEDATIEGWFKRGPRTTLDTILSLIDTNERRWAVYIKDTNRLRTWNSRVGTVNESSSTIAEDTWYHFAFVKQGSSTKLYIDGVLNSNTTNSDPIAASVLEVGAYYNYKDRFTGYIDEIRVSDSVRYTANFTPSTSAFVEDSNTLALLHFEGDNNSSEIDITPSYSFNRLRGLVTGSATGTAQVGSTYTKMGNGSLSLDGASKVNVVAEDYGFQYNEAWTLETWFRKDVEQGRNGALVNINDRSYQNRWAFFLRSDGKVALYNAKNGTFLETAPLITLGTWHHIAYVKTPGSWTVFVDGVAVKTQANYTSLVGGICQIGGWGSGVNPVSGNIDEVRISNVARYTATFTPDTQAFTNDENTLLLLHMDGTDGSTTFIDDNSAYDTGEVKEFSASQSVSSTVSGIVQRSRDTGANFDVTATQTAASGRLRTGNATINGAFSPSITVNATRTVETQLAAEFNTSISANATFDSESLLEFFANLNAQNDRRRDFDSTFSITSNFNTATSVFRDADAVFVSASDLDANVSNTTDINITVDGFATVDASVQRLRSTSVDLTSTFTVLVGAIELSELTLSADFTLDAQTLVFAGVVANLNTQSNLTAISSRRVSMSANPTVTTSVNALAGIQVSAQAALNSSFDLTASVGFRRYSTANLTVTTSVNAQAQRLRTSGARLTVSSGLVASTDKIITTFAELDAQSALSSEPVKTATMSALLNTTSQLNALAGIQVSAQAALNSSFDLTANGRILVVDNIVFVIPNESREFTIAYENR